MAAVTQPQPVKVPHPAWCVPHRCGHIVPPLMREMLRKHRSEQLQVGNLRAPGCVVSYLVGVDGQAPTVTVHATSRMTARGWAELSLAETVQLIGQLQHLLTLAGYPRGGGAA